MAESDGEASHDRHAVTRHCLPPATANVFGGGFHSALTGVAGSAPAAPKDRKPRPTKQPSGPLFPPPEWETFTPPLTAGAAADNRGGHRQVPNYPYGRCLQRGTVIDAVAGHGQDVTASPERKGAGYRRRQRYQKADTAAKR